MGDINDNIGSTSTHLHYTGLTVVDLMIPATFHNLVHMLLNLVFVDFNYFVRT